jgi:hypothetical protein
MKRVLFMVIVGVLAVSAFTSTATAEEHVTGTVERPTGGQIQRNNVFSSDPNAFYAIIKAERNLQFAVDGSTATSGDMITVNITLYAELGYNYHFIPLPKVSVSRDERILKGHWKDCPTETLDNYEGASILLKTSTDADNWITKCPTPATCSWGGGLFSCILNPYNIHWAKLEEHLHKTTLQFVSPLNASAEFTLFTLLDTCVRNQYADICYSWPVFEDQTPSPAGGGAETVFPAEEKATKITDSLGSVLERPIGGSDEPPPPATGESGGGTSGAGPSESGGGEASPPPTLTPGLGTTSQQQRETMANPRGVDAGPACTLMPNASGSAASLMFIAIGLVPILWWRWR